MKRCWPNKFGPTVLELLVRVIHPGKQFQFLDIAVPVFKGKGTATAALLEQQSAR